MTDEEREELTRKNAAEWQEIAEAGRRQKAMADSVKPGDWVLIGVSATAVEVTRTTPQRIYHRRGGYESHYDKKYVSRVGNGQTINRMERELREAKAALKAAQDAAAIAYSERVSAIYAAAKHDYRDEVA